MHIISFKFHNQIPGIPKGKNNKQPMITFCYIFRSRCVDFPVFESSWRIIIFVLPKIEENANTNIQQNIAQFHRFTVLCARPIGFLLRLSNWVLSEIWRGEIDNFAKSNDLTNNLSIIDWTSEVDVLEILSVLPKLVRTTYVVTC